MMKIRKLLVCLVCIVLPAAGLVLAGDGVKARYEGSVDVEYTDNLFHFSGERLDEFDLEQDTNPRYAGLESTSDLISRLSLKAEYDWDLSGKKRFSLDLAASHYLHMDNSVADYTRLGARAMLRTSKRNRWSLGVGQTLDRFKKNYLATSATLPPEWGAASYDQTDLELGYRRMMRGKKDLDVTWRRRDRSFNEMFRDRDLDGNFLGLEAGYPLRNRWRGSSFLEIGSMDSEIGFDGPVLVDRSYDQVRLTQTFRGKVASKAWLSFDLDYRARDYSTDVELDDARFRRTDKRLRIEAALEKKVSRKATLRGGLSWADNNQDRIGTTLMADESGYDELALTFGLGYRF